MLAASQRPDRNAGNLYIHDDVSYGNLSRWWEAELSGLAGSGTAETSWSLTGNSGTSPDIDFLGTTDNQPLVIRTNNVEALRISEFGTLVVRTLIDGGGIALRGTNSPVRDVGLNFGDDTPNSAFIGFVSVPNAWMEGTLLGDILVQSVNGRVCLGSGRDTDTPKVIISNEPTLTVRGDLQLTDVSGGDTIFLGVGPNEAVVLLGGGGGLHGHVALFNSAGSNRIDLDGDSGRVTCQLDTNI